MMLKLKKALAVLLSYALLSSICILPAAAADDGWGADYESASAFTISTADELKQFSGLVSSGKDFAGKTVTLAENIQLDPAEQWTPVGAINGGDNIPFAGTFDGNGRSVSGMTITCLTDDQPAYKSMGLFGTVGGTVKNLTVDSYQIDATIDSAGGIAGKLAHSGAIENCATSGRISGGIYDGEYMGGYFGGIVGSSEGAILNCTASGTLTGGYFIGGIVGEGDQRDGSTISACTNYADIVQKRTDPTEPLKPGGPGHAGGIAGAVNASIINCRNEGSVTGDAVCIGGIVGSVTNWTETIAGCVNMGPVTGAKEVGGIIGGCTDKILISSCTNYGSVTGDDLVGGIIGANESTVENCLNIGAVTGKAPNSVGGIVGSNTVDSNFPGAAEGSYWYNASAAEGFGSAGEKVTDCCSVSEKGILATPTGGKSTLAEVMSGNDAIPTYTVAFSSEHGDAPDAMTQVVGFSVGLPDVAEHVADRHTFSGWRFGEDMYQPDSLFNAPEDVTVAAVWAPPSADPDTEITGMPDPIVLPHSDITLSAPTRDTYSYKWQKSTDTGASWADIGTDSAYTIPSSEITMDANGWRFRCEICNAEAGVEPTYKLSPDTIVMNVRKGSQAAPDSKLVYGGTEQITGVTAAMEYQADGASAWTACPEGSVTGLSFGSYFVRYAETEFLSASSTLAVTVSAHSGGGGGGGGSSSKPSGPSTDTKTEGTVTTETTTTTTTNADGSKTTETTEVAKDAATGAATETTITETVAKDGSKTTEAVKTETAADGSKTETKTTVVQDAKTGVTAETAVVKDSAGAATATVEATAKAETQSAGGKTTAAVSAETAAALAAQAQKAVDSAKAENAAVTATVTIVAEAPASSASVEVRVPASALSTIADTGARIQIAAGASSVTLDTAALGAVTGAADSEAAVAITVTAAAADTLPQAAQAQLAEAAVVELSISVGQNKVSDFGGGSAAVAVPYTQKDESKTVIVYFVADDGAISLIPGAVYDRKSGRVHFSTGHFSSYAITELAWASPFTDVRGGDWYYAPVQYAVQNGLMSGTSATAFEPDSAMTRAMFATVLARLNRQELAGGDTWYAQAMAWAKAAGISDGTAPNDHITREQLATMLWRYAGSPSPDGETAAAAFSDAAEISAWAAQPVSWAFEQGILTGQPDGTFAPQGGATRAEAAAMLQRLIACLAK